MSETGLRVETTLGHPTIQFRCVQLGHIDIQKFWICNTLILVTGCPIKLKSVDYYLDYNVVYSYRYKLIDPSYSLGRWVNLLGQCLTLPVNRCGTGLKIQY